MSSASPESEVTVPPEASEVTTKTGEVAESVKVENGVDWLRLLGTVSLTGGFYMELDILLSNPYVIDKLKEKHINLLLK